MKLDSNAQYIYNLIAQGEHVSQDFKYEISDARKIARSVSAFANTEGGRLLVGVKDNGKIAGVRSEEEIYMIEAAARVYCSPEVAIECRIYKIEGKDVLEAVIPQCGAKPVCAIDEQNRRRAYVRIADENILATPVHLDIWRRTNSSGDTMITYDDSVRSLLAIIDSHPLISLNRCCRLSGMPRRKVCALIADFIRFSLVEQVWEERKFLYRTKNTPTEP